MSRRVRWAVETGLAVVGVVLAALSLVWPSWIEAVTTAAPDGGDGSAERWLAVVWLALAVTFALLARRDRRLAAATA